jgi:hypothetical protein
MPDVPRSPETRRIPYHLCRNDTAFRHALHLPAFNPHLTKSRLNDGLCLCEMLHRNMTGHGTSRGNKVEPFWAQGV